MRYKFYSTLIGLVLLVSALFGQNYLSPMEGYKAFQVFPDYTNFGAFDLNDSLMYGNKGDTIYCLNLDNGQVLKKYGLPGGYTGAFTSFLSIGPGGKRLWVGYTVFGNTDDRIYSIDIETGEWILRATFPGNFDLEFWNNSILISGLNSTDWSAPCAIFLLDTSSTDTHRKIVEVGGYASGLAVDSEGNLYCGTSFASDPNAIYQWDSTDVAVVVNDSLSDALLIYEGKILTDLPAGVNDCEIDDGGSLIFNFNDFVSDNVLAVWNGTEGEGSNFDTLAVADSDWLGMVKSQGDVRLPVTGNRIFTVAYGQPVVGVHLDYIPVAVKSLAPVSGLAESDEVVFDLDGYFTDPDDEDDFTFQVSFISDTAVANAHISGNELSVNFITAGQTNMVVTATNAGNVISELLVVGVQPELVGDYLLSDFEDLSLDPESYWNGADGSGEFTTGVTRFYNDYNPEWYSWSGWAASSTTDNQSPGWLNQYSAITGAGYKTGAGSSESGGYGVGYASWPSVMDFRDGKAHTVNGFFVTNSTYTGFSMQHGDGFAKKFGGFNGSDPDYYKLSVWGRIHSVDTDTIEFYLADYRFDNPVMDYIIKTWQWVDLSALGKVDSLLFALSSSDMGDWGMNTPGYFCVDDIYVKPDETPVVVNPLNDVHSFISAPDTVIDLSNVFSDPDDDDAFIIKSIQSNTNEALVSTQITGNELSLFFALVTGEAEIVIEGISNGLSATDTFHVFVKTAVGVEDKDPIVAEIYPNPGIGKFVIRSNSGKALDIKIYNLTGSLVYENGHYISSRTIDISNQPAGSYILRIKTDKQVISKIILKQ